MQIEYVTLHVGLGTLQSVREENLKTGKLHNEVFEITTDVADRLNKKKEGQLFIQPGVKFKDFGS